MVVLEVIITLLVADFVSGLFHWLEDAYGREEWPITGRLVTRPNILHHHNPRYFTRHVWLFVALGVNANQIHKWAHRSPVENGPIITFLQCIWLLQTPRHHAQHHT